MEDVKPKHLVLQVGKGRLVVDPDKITLKKIKDLAKAVTEIKIKNSIFARYPMKDNESPADYQKRVNQEIADNPIDKKEDETSEQYVHRIHNSMSSHSVLFEVLQAIAETFGQGDKLSEDAYDETPYLKVKDFVTSVLDYCDLS